MPRFGSSGIRGLGNVDVTPELALHVGMVIADFYGDTLIGKDPRLTGSMLGAALSAGVLSSGSDAVEARRYCPPAPCPRAEEFQRNGWSAAPPHPRHLQWGELWK